MGFPVFQEHVWNLANSFETLEIVCSSLPRNHKGARNWLLEPARPCWGARNGSSGPLGSAGAIENCAQACSVSLEHSNWALKPARLRWGARSGCSNRSKQPFETARLRWGGRNRCPGLLALAGAFEFGTRTRSVSLGRSTSLLKLTRMKKGAKKLFGNAVLWSQFALNTWLGSSLLRAWICTGSP